MSSITPLPKRPLGNTGLHVSVLGFGASPLGSVFQAINEDVGVKAVQEAFNRGINFFDTSPFYGITKSETVLGRGLVTLPRDKIVVATKVGRYGAEEFDFSAERVTRSVHESLARLQIPYIDVIQTHDIEFGDLDQVINETIPALQKLKDEGLVRHIGITGLPMNIFHYVLDRVPPNTIDTVLSYCHHTLSDKALEDNMPYLKSKAVGIINASPLCMGLFTPQGPPPWHPAPQELQEAANKAGEIAAAHGVDLPKLAISEALQNGDIATHLVGLSTPDEVNKNVETALQALGLVANPTAAAEQQALAEIREIMKPVMNLTWPSGKPENN